VPLSANSISNLFGAGTTEVHELIHFYDELLSHYLWHAGILGLSAMLVFAPVDAGAKPPPMKRAVILPGVLLYGFPFFVAVDEGGGVPMGLLAVVVLLVGLLLARRRLLRSHNLISFFFAGYLFALVLFVIWFLVTGGFPEFSGMGGSD